MKLRLVGLSAVSLLPLAGLACGEPPPPPQTPPPPPPPVVAPPPVATPPADPQRLDKLTRAEFNRVAPELALPLFWISDNDKNNILEPAELAVYWGLDKGAKLDEYIRDGKFTNRMLEVYAAMVKQKETPPKDARDAAVRKELAQGRVTLVASDFSKSTADEKKFVTAILKAAEKIETLYAKQEGTLDLMTKIPASDPASRALFIRNQEPKCKAPATETDPNCGALPIADMPKTKISGMYPADLLAKDEKFCEKAAKVKDAKYEQPFTTIEKADDKGNLKAKSFHDTWPADVKAISDDIKEASAALGQTEPALRAYLDAAAKSFLDDNWWPADEAWAKMDTKNSKFYLRIGPDEVYHEPCSTKALFHVSFALVNQGAAKWQAKLDPLKTEMENAIAKLAGAPYTARKVAFKIPDFIDVVLNAGDARMPSGATIGQSLPNFGPVANQGRGRTVAMTNFYTDQDSVMNARSQAESLFCKETMAKWTDDPEALLMSTVLHEAAHNLGPAHQYKANGKIDRDAFGGPLASTLEELKAQTAALYYTDWLVEKKQLEKDSAEKSFVRDMFWAFGHVSRGMYEDNHHPKNYSQLAAIQVGWLMKNGAMAWKDAETAANGKDKGCFAVDLPKIPTAVTSLMTEVAQIKGTGNKARAEVLIKDWVDVTGDKKKVHEVITERMTRAPKQTFVYSVKLD